MATTLPSASALDSLFRGAAIGSALSKQMGLGTAEGTDITGELHAYQLAHGVATGQINPASLNKQDTAALSSVLAIPKIPQAGGGGILDVLSTPFKVIANTGGDLVNAVESLPQGLAQLAQSGAKTFAESDFGRPFGLNKSSVSGPDLFGLAGDIAKSTVHDFTNFDPMHPLYPALDLATIISGGTSALARTGGALSRLAATGRAAEAGAEVGNLSGLLGRTATVQRLGDLGQKLAFKFGGGGERPIPATQAAPSGIKIPTTPTNYSISPFRRLAIEQPIDALFNSNIAQAQIPGLAQGTTLADLRGGYQLRKMANTLRGRASAESINQGIVATQGFNRAMQHLIDTSTNDTVAGEKFNALVLLRMLGAENMTPEERLAILEEYRNKVLATGTPPTLEGIPITPETKAIRDFNRKLTASPQFEQYFSEPDSAMWTVRNEWDKALMQGLRAFHVDPNEILQRSLGPAAYIRDRTPEELLREQPENVQRSMNFALGAHDIEQALKESGGAAVPEEQLIPQLAAQLPGTDLVKKTQLLRDAVESLRADIAGEHTPRELLNNAHTTGYLPGNNLAQKVATQLPTRLGVPEHVAEPFASGGLTNYFPQVSAHPNMTVRPNGGPISRQMNKMLNKIPTVHRETGQLGLHEFKRENMSRLLNANSIGVEPFASFLQKADLNAFKAGVDRRDPIIFVRHIAQRERVLTHRLLSEPFLEGIALKDAEGNVIRVANDAEKAEVLGSTVLAQKYTIISPQALQVLVQQEDKAALDVANALKLTGEVTPELMASVDRIVEESAAFTVRGIADSAIEAKGRGIIVPNAYVQNLIKQAKVLDSGYRAGRLWQGFINKWRSAVLAYMPSWLLRTSVGHGFILFLSGVWNPRDYIEAMRYFEVQHLPKDYSGFRKTLQPGLKDFHETPEATGRAVPPGVVQGMPHSDFGQIGQHEFAKASIAPAITGGVHRIANFQRRAAFLSILNRVVKQHFAELGEAFELPHGIRNYANLDKVMTDHPEWVSQVLNELDRVSYTFGQMSPWERRLAKNILPFWGWYRFVSKFVWTMPLTMPGRTLAITRLGQIGQSDQNLLGPMPDWLRASIMFDTHNLSKVHYFSMLGLNPLGDVMNPSAGFQGLVRLGQMSPIIQAALEGAGYNTLTGGLESIDPASGIVEVNGRFVNIHTGQMYDSLDQASLGADVSRFFGGLMRSFPEIRLAELASTKGLPVYPESIPFVNERPIPTTNTKNVSAGGLLASYAGVAPRTYDLQKYQLNLLKDIKRAMSTSRRAVIKEKALP